MEEKNESQLENGNCETDKISENIFDFKKICSKKCTICSSDYLKEIHDLKKRGMKHTEIVSHFFSTYKIKLSESSLCRHFQNYNKMKVEMSTKIIKEDTISEITAQSVHLKKTVELLDLAYDQLLEKIRARVYRIEISDLEKLTKMRYQILNGEDLDDKNVMAIFQKASNEYGLDLNQGILFKG